MKIAFQTSKYNNTSLIEEVKTAKKNRLDYFDIFFDTWSPEDLTDCEKKYITTCKKEGMIFSIHLPIIDYSKVDENFKSYIEFINEIIPYSVTIHFNTLSYSTIEYFLASINSKVFFSIENTIPDKNFLYESDYLTFMKEVSSKYNVYSTFDIGHCVVNKYDLIQYFNSIIDSDIRISTFHIHDNDGIQDMHKALGEGTISYKKLFNEYKKTNLDSLFIIEHWTNNCMSLQALRNEK